MNTETFEDYLEKQYFEEESPSKHQMEDGFDKWLSELDVQEVMDYAQKYADKQKEEIKEKANAYDEDGEPVKIYWS